ncbi:hypothetical protein [Lentzea flaviverrucosa]|uniref:hypothetical protein n=1 Tax=Lentzea flaviverrucosa TaxID=200379 RepID=UPI000B8019CE|nr:hypothetical protein [Lentzea flaviverrucosa]
MAHHLRPLLGGAVVHTDRPARTRRPLNWVLLGVALALLIAGIAAPHALLVAAGLIVAGLIGLGHRR